MRGAAATPPRESLKSLKTSWTVARELGNMDGNLMKTRKGFWLVFSVVICLHTAGCVAIPPLITVQQKESDSALRSRVESLERRVQQLEERK